MGIALFVGALIAGATGSDPAALLERSNAKLLLLHEPSAAQDWRGLARRFGKDVLTVRSSSAGASLFTWQGCALGRFERAEDAAEVIETWLDDATRAELTFTSSAGAALAPLVAESLAKTPLGQVRTGRRMSSRGGAPECRGVPDVRAGRRWIVDAEPDASRVTVRLEGAEPGCRLAERAASVGRKPRAAVETLVKELADGLRSRGPGGQFVLEAYAAPADAERELGLLLLSRGCAVEARRALARAAERYRRAGPAFSLSLAEVYTASGQHREAAEVYRTLLATETEPARAVEWSTRAIEALAEHIDRDRPLFTFDERRADPVKPAPLSEEWRTLVDWCEQLLREHADAAEAAEATYRAAEAFYRHDQLDTALPRLAAVFDRWPKAEAAIKAANLIIEIYIGERDWDQVERWSRRVADKIGRSCRGCCASAEGALDAAKAHERAFELEEAAAAYAEQAEVLCPGDAECARALEGLARVLTAGPGAAQLADRLLVLART